MRIAFALLSLPLIAFPAWAQGMPLNPRQVGELFCASTLADDMGPIEAILTPKLVDMVATAWDNDATYKAVHPEENSPLWHGLPWHGFSKVVDGCSVGALDIGEDKASVAVNYSISNFPDGNYTDLIQLERIKIGSSPVAVWRVADMEFADEQGTLTHAL